MKIGVFGLGYVGIVNIACLSKLGHTVYCTDVKKQKIQFVKEGKSPILEPEVDDLINEGIKNGKIIPSDNIQEIVSESEIIIICVGTPSKADGEVNLDYLNNVSLEISQYITSNSHKYIVYRSTVPPGTTEKISQLFFEKNGENLTTVFYPEFLREGTAVKDFFEYGRFVLGTDKSKNILPLLKVLHVNVDSPLFITDYKTAEFAKYIDNSFHALKVAYSNEVFGLGAELGVNISDSHKIFIADNKLNISHRYLKPGTPFGGSCLPKDLRELQHLKNKSSRKFSILESIIPSNENFITYIINTITSFNKNKISFIGITFKNDSDDLRESPILKILLELKQKSVDYSFNIFDEDLNADNVRIDFPYLYSGILNLESCVENGEILVVTKRYFEQTKKLKKANQILLNLSDIVNADLKDNIYNIYCP